MNCEDTLPPVIRILLNENTKIFTSPQKSKELLSELRRQAMWTNKNWSYADDQSSNDVANDFSVTLSGTSNPLSTYGLCAETACRIQAANYFARTVGLYADVAFIPDTLTSKLLYPSKFSGIEMFRFINDVLVLHTLSPLIKEGIVRFYTGTQQFCKECYQKAEETIEKATTSLASDLHDEIKYTIDKHSISIDAGMLYEDGMILDIPMSPKIRRELKNTGGAEEVGRKIFEEELRNVLTETLIAMHTARKLDSPLFSSSKMSLLSLKALEEGAHYTRDIEMWEKERSIELPWVKDLSAEQIIRLRNEAFEALPSIRELIRRVLSTSMPESAITDAVAELRAEAAEVSAELKALNANHETHFRSLAGSLGMVISIYGFATGFMPPAMALGSLITLLTLLHSSAHKDEQEEAKLRARPAYVLLKAQEIYKHGPHSR
ncbi:MAG: hypothetical protein ACYDGO_09785 [Smithellaceae bacterium]